MKKQHAIIIGAGPAGLTAAYELLKRTDIIPVILEKSGDIGGISKTVNYKGNRIDIGGHRFFSKSDRVMNWWLNMMPIQAEGRTSLNISYQHKSREIDVASIGVIDNAGKDPDKVMLVRRRLSRIYFLRKFFTYPIQLSLDTLTKLGLWTTIAIMLSYLKAQLLPRKPEKNLEDFMINRFGQVLYKLFFKDYTEKVWGIPCGKISAEWGAQRIKGVSVSKAIQHAVQSATKKRRKANGNDIAQKDTETSLIEQFLYPKFGPGQLWEEVARQVESMGGKILMQHDVKRIYTSDSGHQVTAVAAINNITGETSYLEGDYFISTMPVQELIGGLDGPIPEDVKHVAAGLQYRDFITVGILLKQLSFQDKQTGEWKPIDLKDTWIYIQEKDVKVGRLQLFNNWSPYMVKDPDNAWVGMEFFCDQKDEFWNMKDEDIKQLAISELEKIGLASTANVLDATVLRMEKTYPAYFGTYERFEVVREYVDGFENLFLVGRNGMHKYNNSDHSMLTAMVAVDNIVAGEVGKGNIWEINTEQEYHEEKQKACPLIAVQEKTNDDQHSATILNHILRHQANRKLLLLALIGTVLQFIFFKLLYPAADYSNDSYTYIYVAAVNDNISVRPVGYSKFLRAFSAITTSDLILTGFQYILLQAAALYFFFTIKNFFKPGIHVNSVIFTLLLFNPATLYMANYISSDGVFSALSLIWLTHLIWMINNSRKSSLIISLSLLMLILSLRYNALFYPLIAAAAFIMSNQRLSGRLIYTLTTFLCTAIFILFIANATYKQTATKNFSAFGGWQLASNSLFILHTTNTKEIQFHSGSLKELDKIVKDYIDTAQYKPQPSLISGYYLWDDHAPLKQYWFRYIKKNSIRDSANAWHAVGPIFAEYGATLIRKFPIEFTKSFLLPNIKEYLIPELEVFQRYNIGQDTVKQIAKQWFRYDTTRVNSPLKRKQFLLLAPLRMLFGISNVVLAICTIILLIKGYYTTMLSSARRVSLLLTLFLSANFAFSIFAAPIVFRYQYMPLLVCTPLCLLLVGTLISHNKVFTDPPNTNHL
jgi:protoporphyrinogen oxidase